MNPRNQGFSLPLTWLLLFGICVCVYWFGWRTLLVVGGLAVAATLATAIHDAWKR